MSTEMGVFLTGLSSYSFNDPKTGEVVEGIKIHCLSQAPSRPGTVGFEGVVFPAPYNLLPHLLTEVRAILGDKMVAPAKLMGDFQKRGKNLTFVVQDVYAE